MKILIILESGVGNVILLTPLIKSLHDFYDKVEVTLLSSRYREEGKILEGWEYLKECIYTANDLRPQDFDKVLVSPMYGSIFNYFLDKVPKDKLIKIGGNRSINWNAEHEVEINMRFLREQGYPTKAPGTEVITKKVKLPKLNKKKYTIGFHTGCQNHPDYAKKLWLNNRWDELAERLQDELGAQILWFGAGEDYSNKKISINLVNKYSDIKQTAYVISKCDLFISLDSGLMHLADALKVPTIGLFGPTLPSKNRPWNGAPIIQSRLCLECYFTERFRTCKDNKCMREITVDEIIKEVDRILNSKLKVCLVACRQLGETLKNTLRQMNIDFFHYDYLHNSNFVNKVAESGCNLILVLHGVQFEIGLLDQIDNVKKVLWFNDNVCRYEERFKEMIPHFDKIFTINQDNPRGIGFIPCGIDTTQFTDLKIRRDINVSFVGNVVYQNRLKWAKEVRDNLDIEWFNDLDYTQYVNVLNRSKITINHHYNEYGANMRFYEALACKSLMITDKVVGIPPDLIEGKHYLTYIDVPDLVKKVKYYLNHRREREKITGAAYKIVNKKHKYSDRLKEIFKEMKI